VRIPITTRARVVATRMTSVDAVETPRFSRVRMRRRNPALPVTGNSQRHVEKPA
jgi:hypothetical protein